MTDRQCALVDLLAMPDPPGMRRRHVLKFAGDPRRRERVLLPLLVRWKVRWEIDRDPSTSSARLVALWQARRTA